MWNRCREKVSDKPERWALDHAALRNYLDAGGSLVEGFEQQEILDAVLVVGAVKNGARFDDEDDEDEDADG